MIVCQFESRLLRLIRRLAGRRHQGNRRLNPIARYTHWLHTQWPAGKPEKLPVVNDDGTTNVSGLYVVGDLSGIPLLKLSVNAGTRVVRDIAGQSSFQKRDHRDDVLDIAICGGGTAGFAAAKECERLGARYMLFEASQPFSTIVNFPRAKPIYTYPTNMDFEGDITFHEKSDVKEGLLEDLREQTVEQGLRWCLGRVSHVEKRGALFEVVVPDGVDGSDGMLHGSEWIAGQQRIRAHRVIVAIGRSGNYRKLNVPGEELNKVYNRLHDPADYCEQDVLVVGGGDSAMETAIALTMCGANVTLSYRRAEFNRPKPDNVEKINALAENPEARADIEEATDQRQGASIGEWMQRHEPRGMLTLRMPTNVRAIREDEVDLEDDEGNVEAIPNDSVFAMIGREPPLEFFRRTGVRIVGERTARWWFTLIAFLVFCVWMFHWKGDKSLLGIDGLKLPAWLIVDPSALWGALQSAGGFIGEYFSDHATIGGTIAISASGRSFYYTLAYALAVTIFGIRRIRRRKTPYVNVQTWTLMAIQIVPLFLLPEIILPWMGHNGWFDGGPMGWLADQFFPIASYGHGREYWRCYGLILAWPLMAWNWFTSEPIWGWLVLGSLQTFVFIPAIIYFWGKGAYCGWICSCGALAETLGDQHRHKMVHGPFWNRFNMVGQVLLGFAVIIMVVRIVAWIAPGTADNPSWASAGFNWLANDAPLISWAWFVDLLWAGVIGVGMYFWFSGRVWCRFACPLAALMHIYHRFGRFRILADKSKCISCNVCTSVCHQGIDVMSFANKGRPMADPQCVRCSACVQSCPTGVLYFGQVDRNGKEIRRDRLSASIVRLAEVELTVNGKKAP